MISKVPIMPNSKPIINSVVEKLIPPPEMSDISSGLTLDSNEYNLINTSQIKKIKKKKDRRCLKYGTKI